ncbi:uncharacterized protein LOC141854238 [Brevipalpus obovatus]|uniref:uncharacterized protein LOC141854238 n=1 Tax=Brevipalpus obovatus TaxID=246614 RepID=UPI003D9F98B5
MIRGLPASCEQLTRFYSYWPSPSTQHQRQGSKIIPCTVMMSSSHSSSPQTSPSAMGKCEDEEDQVRIDMSDDSSSMSCPSPTNVISTKVSKLSPSKSSPICDPNNETKNTNNNTLKPRKSEFESKNVRVDVEEDEDGDDNDSEGPLSVACSEGTCDDMSRRKSDSTNKSAIDSESRNSPTINTNNTNKNNTITNNNSSSSAQRSLKSFLIDDILNHKPKKTSISSQQKQRQRSPSPCSSSSCSPTTPLHHHNLTINHKESSSKSITTSGSRACDPSDTGSNLSAPSSMISSHHHHSNRITTIVRPWDTRPISMVSSKSSSNSKNNNNPASNTHSHLHSPPSPHHHHHSHHPHQQLAHRLNGFIGLQRPNNAPLVNSVGGSNVNKHAHHHSNHHHHHHHHHHMTSTPTNRRPRSADDDSRSERSDTSDTTPESPVGNNENGSSILQNPLDCLYELSHKTFDRIKGEKPIDGSGDHLSIFSKGPPQKKKRKSRTAFTNTQIFELERKFMHQKYLSPADRDELALRLGLTGAQVITWFQNRRAKMKREKEETDKDLEATHHQLITINHHKDFYENIQDLSLFKPDIQATLQFHRKP